MRNIPNWHATGKPSVVNDKLPVIWFVINVVKKDMPSRIVRKIQSQTTPKGIPNNLPVVLRVLPPLFVTNVDRPSTPSANVPNAMCRNAQQSPKWERISPLDNERELLLGKRSCYVPNAGHECLSDGKASITSKA